MWSIIALSGHLPLYAVGQLDCVDGAAMHRVNGKRRVTSRPLLLSLVPIFLPLIFYFSPAASSPDVLPAYFSGQTLLSQTMQVCPMEIKEPTDIAGTKVVHTQHAFEPSPLLQPVHSTAYCTAVSVWTASLPPGVSFSQGCFAAS